MADRQVPAEAGGAPHIRARENPAASGNTNTFERIALLMIVHVVLFSPRSGLSRDDQHALFKAFELAVTTIPTVRRVRVGRRVRHGAGYEARSGAAEFVATIAFDSLEGLQAYLEHPAHEELGRRFGTQLELAEVYDFEEVAVEELARTSGYA